LTTTIDKPDGIRTDDPELQAAHKRLIAELGDLGVEQVDLKFVDLFGAWQHFSVPTKRITESALREGIGFDGSSIRGFQKIHESDMVLMPDADTLFADPFNAVPTASAICTVHEPITLEPYSRDPRHIAIKAEKYLSTTGIATTSYWGPEIEFYVFNSLAFDQTSSSAYFYIDSVEGIWDSGDRSKPNLAFRPRTKEGYFPVPPTDKLQDLRSEIVRKLVAAGVEVEAHHHEVGTAGQSEIDIRFTTLVDAGDRSMLYKYIVKNACYEQGYVATFMPKPLFGDNGSGMHTHQSLFRDDTNLFFDSQGYASLSDTARWYIGGLLHHAPSLLAFSAPTTNSYRRLVPGFEAPVKLAYSQRNRSACVRIPSYSDSPVSRRVEFRSPDPSSNPYLAFASMLMAGIDGIERQIEPPSPIDRDLYELEQESVSRIESLPGSLGEVLSALEDDHEYLLRGGVFTSDLIESWVETKREREVDAVAGRPHPYEFFLYHDC
jgi:glutamine synthetase